MINRDLPARCLPGLTVQQKGFTCSTGDVLSGAAINGVVVDRLGLGQRYQFRGCSPFIHAYTTVGSTAPDQKITLSIKLQHGDSSGAGDMADYTTGLTSPDRSFLTTAMTTPMQNWSTGLQRWDHLSHYEITSAKRYVRAVGSFTRGGSSTSTAAGSIDGVYLDLGLIMRESDNLPFTESSSTSTSTST